MTVLASFGVVPSVDLTDRERVTISDVLQAWPDGEVFVTRAQYWALKRQVDADHELYELLRDAFAGYGPVRVVIADS